MIEKSSTRQHQLYINFFTQMRICGKELLISMSSSSNRQPRRRSLVIFGTGGLTQEVIGYLRHYSPHINIEGVVSRDPKEIGKHFQDVLVVGAENEDGAYWLSSRPEEGVIAIGNPEIRYKIANRIRMNWSTLIFAQDLVLVNNRIHEGVVIC